jgi:hypothetical protein
MDNSGNGQSQSLKRPPYAANDEFLEVGVKLPKISSPAPAPLMSEDTPNFQEGLYGTRLHSIVNFDGEARVFWEIPNLLKL